MLTSLAMAMPHVFFGDLAAPAVSNVHTTVVLPASRIHDLQSIAADARARGLDQLYVPCAPQPVIPIPAAHFSPSQTLTYDDCRNWSAHLPYSVVEWTRRQQGLRGFAVVDDLIERWR